MNNVILLNKRPVGKPILKIQTHDNKVFVYHYDEIDRIIKVEVHQNYYLYPGLSWDYSFLYPGGGQFYNGQYTKGMIIATSSLAFLMVGVYSNNYSVVPFLGYGCLWVYSMIDASLYAIKVNKANTLSYNLSPALLNLAMVSKPYPGLSFSVKF